MKESMARRGWGMGSVRRRGGWGCGGWGRLEGGGGGRGRDEGVWQGGGGVG